MTYVMGQPFIVGRYTVAVVSRQAVEGRRLGRQGIGLACHKEPAFVVVQDGQGRAVLNMMGQEVPMAEVAALCPAVTAL